MKNIPKKIYLNIGLNPYEKDDFYDIDDVTWSEGVTGNNDIEYILATPALKAAHDERQRQIEKEGYDEKHDDEHVSGELAQAAAMYSLPNINRAAIFSETPYHWPWSPEDWKPTPDDRKREITKAMALLIAEYERLERMEETK